MKRIDTLKHITRFVVFPSCLLLTSSVFSELPVGPWLAVDKHAAPENLNVFAM